ncbi:type II and III secretion system protein family protein [Variovorax sp. RHLX14]|uniref:type II and III secretion system protein family protein n=1 Tax=Variovorax sp. RHLX14 TaxID=1259731 RepID=UPI003F45BAB8
MPATFSRKAAFAVMTLVALALPAALPAAAPFDAADNAAPRLLRLPAGAQRELMFDKGVERIAIADESVATVTVSRKTSARPPSAGSGPGATAAARLIITGKKHGQSTLMVWERGSTAATTYAIEVQRPMPLIEGSVADVPAYRQAREEALAAYADKAVPVDRAQVEVRSHTVQVEVRVVEFSRSVLKQAGLNLSSYGPNNHGFSFLSTSPGMLSEAFNLALNFGNANKGRGMQATLQLLQQNGLARVLAEPTLVTVSGQSASFLSGGELPIPVPQGLGTTSIEYKPFGIGLSVTPTVLSNERIVLKVAPEVSDIDYGNSLNIGGSSVPAISTRRADTTVELGDGESFVIGGLVSRTTSSNVDKVPLLGDLPVIGSFFRNNRYTMNEKELVIIATPHLVKPIARGTDLSSQLPGGGTEQRDGPVWRSIFLGAASGDALPGFSR